MEVWSSEARFMRSDVEVWSPGCALQACSRGGIEVGALEQRLRTWNVEAWSFKALDAGYRREDVEV